MFLACLAIAIGLPVLLWSAGKFVGGAASVANHFGVSPLLIGMLIIGFGILPNNLFELTEVVSQSVSVSQNFNG